MGLFLENSEIGIPLSELLTFYSKDSVSKGKNFWGNWKLFKEGHLWDENATDHDLKIWDIFDKMERFNIFGYDSTYILFDSFAIYNNLFFFQFILENYLFLCAGFGTDNIESAVVKKQKNFVLVEETAKGDWLILLSGYLNAFRFDDVGHWYRLKLIK